MGYRRLWSSSMFFAIIVLLPLFFNQIRGIQSTTPSAFSSLCPSPAGSSLAKPAILDANNHICLLNYPKSDYCEYWRVAPLILLTNPFTADQNIQAIQQFLSTVTEYCDQNSSLMPFVPANLNEDCRSFKFDVIDWIGNVTSPKVLVNDMTKAVEIFEDLLTSLFKCTQYGLSDKTTGAVFIFSDLTCDPLCQSSSFGDLVNSLIVNVSVSSKYVTTTYFLGEYSEEEQICLNGMFIFCALYREQICDVRYYSNLTAFSTSGSDQHTCAMKTTNNATKLILAIVLPCILGTILIIILAIIIIRTRSRQRWFKFWWEHTKGESRMGSRRGEAARNDYYDTSALAKKTDDWEINPKLLKVNEDNVLGHGAFAVVYKGILLEPPLHTRKASIIPQIEGKVKNGYEVAVKRLPSHSDNQSRSEFMKELDFMKNLGLHSHIIGLLGCVTTPSDPMIVVEYCHYGDLLTFLRKHKETFVPDGQVPQDESALTMKELLSFSWQISDGMVYLSSRSFIHRDIAARNILLTKNLVAKIGDFGLCREVDTALYTTHGGRLPIKWMAIESLKFYEYTTKSDVWSYAVLLFEIMSFGEGPYQAIQPVDLVSHLEQGNRLPRTEYCPEEIYELMTRCWKKNPEDRPTFTAVREEIGVALNKRDELYGYLALDSCQVEERYIDPIPEEVEV